MSPVQSPGLEEPRWLKPELYSGWGQASVSFRLAAGNTFWFPCSCEKFSHLIPCVTKCWGTSPLLFCCELLLVPLALESLAWSSLLVSLCPTHHALHQLSPWGLTILCPEINFLCLFFPIMTVRPSVGPSKGLEHNHDGQCLRLEGKNWVPCLMRKAWALAVLKAWCFPHWIPDAPSTACSHEWLGWAMAPNL